ncbi:hypothetical protein E2C01_014844 [Portunus trituberculatus]|uniref:Uncharacterized protein n=1 Tax=Portunus trituberculatus TaxID=210409 RepID=A0A5B7DL27_PORTR|nr:hypothetical protein [Portunus trituberculatus]
MGEEPASLGMHSFSPLKTKIYPGSSVTLSTDLAVLVFIAFSASHVVAMSAREVLPDSSASDV